MKKHAIIAASALLFFSLTRIYAQAWSPDSTTIQRLEASIKPGDFPRRSGIPENINGYARYYSGFTDKGHRLIAGEFLRSTIGEGTAGIHIVPTRKAFPVIFDGGCSVINFLYDADSGKMLSVECNGVA